MKKSAMSALKLSVCSLAVIGALTWTGPAVHSFVGLSSVAFADDTPLTDTQQAAVQASVQAAINGVDPTLTGDAKAAAVQAAIATATQNAVAAYGAGAVSVVVSTATTAGVSATTVIAGHITAGWSAFR